MNPKIAQSFHLKVISLEELHREGRTMVNCNFSKTINQLDFELSIVLSGQGGFITWPLSEPQSGDCSD
jgi:hypothetical protein